MAHDCTHLMGGPAAVGLQLHDRLHAQLSHGPASRWPVAEELTFTLNLGKAARRDGFRHLLQVRLPSLGWWRALPPGRAACVAVSIASAR